MKPRLASAWPALAVLAALRIGGGVLLGAAPAGLVLDRVKNMPGGELALFDRDGALFAELVRRPPSLSGHGIAWFVAIALIHVISLPVLAALIHGVAQRSRFTDALGYGARRTGALAVVSLFGAIALAFAAYLGLVSSASLVALFPPGTPARAWAAVGFGALGLLPAAIVAVLVDLVRVETALAPGFIRAGVSAWASFRARSLRLVAIYAAVALGATVLGALGLAASAACAMRPGAGFAFLAAVTAVATTLALVIVRGAWLTALVRTSSAHEPEPLHDPEGVGYEPDPSPGSSVGRAED